MNIFKNIYLKTSGSLCLIFLSLCAYAHNDMQTDFQIMEHIQTVIPGSNAAFLPVYHVDKVAYVELGGKKSFGDFINYYQSDNNLKFHLATKSYFRLSPKLVLYGGMEYSQFIGLHMGTSALIDPLHAPFDIIEMDDAYRGRKRIETYHLQGAVGYQLTRSFSLGGSLDYLAANYAKYKDLRHKNTLMNMLFSLGVSWNPVPAFSAGISYSYHRRNESISFDIYGNTDIQYYSLISFGSFYGIQEKFGESGFTSSSVSKRPPLFSEEHRAAIQFLWKSNKSWSWFNEFGISSLSGRFGTEESMRVTFTHHAGSSLAYQGKFTWNQTEKYHIVELSLQNSKLTNFENAYKEATDEANVTQIIYYGSNEVLRRNELEAKAGYTLYWENKDNRPVWIVAGSVSLYHRDSRTVVYPYYRKQDLCSVRLQTDVRRNIFHHGGIYTLGILAGYGKGWGNAFSDGVYITPGNDQQEPASRNDLLMQEFEYLTSPCLHTGLVTGYERDISEKLSAFLNLTYQYTRAFKTSFNGTHFNVINFTLGCKF